MAKTYRFTFINRLINACFRTLTRLRVGASYRYVLAVRGRRTGRVYRTPVDVMELDDHRYLVAGYGRSNWVYNARAAGEITLRRGRFTSRYHVDEVGPAEAVPVLRQYMRKIRVTREYFDASPDAPDEVVAAELPRHPVLRLAAT